MNKKDKESALDWDKAEKYLKEVRQQYNDIGYAGMFALAAVISPLLIRFYSGERTVDLYNDIMGMS